jgi:Flp pilus assembly protein TadB
VSAPFRRQRQPRQVPRRPYRDSAVLYGALALVIVVVAAATGGNLLRAVLFAVGFFALATAWSWYRWRARVREDRRT